MFARAYAKWYTFAQPADEQLEERDAKAPWWEEEESSDTYGMKIISRTHFVEVTKRP